MKDDNYYKQQVQKALQDDNLHKNDKLCDWDWLLYRVRLGGNCRRFLAHLHSILRSNDSITKEDFQKLENQFLQNNKLKDV